MDDGTACQTAPIEADPQPRTVSTDAYLSLIAAASFRCYITCTKRKPGDIQISDPRSKGHARYKLQKPDGPNRKILGLLSLMPEILLAW